MGTSVGTFVTVQVDHNPAWKGYKSAGFTYSFKPSSGDVANREVQVISVQVQGGARLYYREYTGYLSGMTFNWQGDATAANFAPQGQRHEFVVANTTWDSGGDGRFYAQAWATGHSFYTPRLNASMFTNGTATTTSRNITYTGLDTPQSERLSYQNWNATGYRQNSPGTKNGSVNYSGIPLNTKQELAFGMIAQSVDEGYLGNGEDRRVLVPVYPAYSKLIQGSFSAERVLNIPGTIKAVWGAWSNFGTITGAKAYLDAVDLSTGTVLKSQSINVNSSGSSTMSGVPLDKPIGIQIRVTLKYFDNTNKTDLGRMEDLGYSSLVHYATADGVTARVVSTQIAIEDGVLAKVVGIPFIME